MKLQRALSISCVCLGLAFAGVAQAFDMGNMMNPSRWMGGGNYDRYDDDYGYGDYGYGGMPGYGYGGMPGYDLGGMPGYGYGGMPGYGYGGMPGYGYGGMPGYGYGGASGYGGAPAYSAPGSNSDAEEIKRLQDRIKKLEESSRQDEDSNWGTTGNQGGDQWYNR